MKRQRFDLAVILVVAMGLAMIPGFFGPEIELAGYEIRTERVLLGYCMVAMSALCVAITFEARRLLAARPGGRRRIVPLALICGAGLLLCFAVLWGLALFAAGT